MNGGRHPRSKTAAMTCCVIRGGARRTICETVPFIRGLWSNPCSWSPMVEALEADPALRDRFQFWTSGYSTGDPIPHSALLLRHNLDAVRRKFDPDRTDATFERTVVDPHDCSKELR